MSLEIYEKKFPDHHKFKLFGGGEFASLKEMHEYLPEMSEDQFRHHVNEEKNDIAQWVEDLHGSPELAMAMREIETKDELLKVFEKFFAPKDEAPVEEGKREEEEPTSPSGEAAKVPPKKLESYKAPRELISREQSAPEGEGIVSDDGEKLRASKPITDDEQFKKLHEEFEGRNEKLSDKFDDVATAMQETIDDVLPEDIEKRLEDLQTRFDELKAKLSEFRKEGKEMVLPAMMMRSFNAKKMYAKASREETDLKKLDELLHQIEVEVTDAGAQEVVDVKKEVLKLADLEHLPNVEDPLLERIKRQKEEEEKMKEAAANKAMEDAKEHSVEQAPAEEKQESASTVPEGKEEESSSEGKQDEPPATEEKKEKNAET